MSFESDNLSPRSSMNRTLTSRRRPGRPNDVYSTLIPLLRGASTPNAEPQRPLPTAAHTGDDLGSASGILRAAIWSLPFWCLLGLGLYFMIP